MIQDKAYKHTCRSNNTQFWEYVDYISYIGISDLRLNFNSSLQQWCWLHNLHLYVGVLIKFSIAYYNSEADSLSL